MNRKFWVGSFDPKKPPKYPCPTCAAGKLAIMTDTTHTAETAYSQNEHGHDAWDPDWIVERFSMMLRCDEADCGEVVCVSGNTAVLEFYEETPDGYEPSYATAFRPSAMYPAPAMITVPENAPEEVQDPLKQAFGLYWIDTGAAAARVRVSLERLLDDKLVPTESMNAAGETHVLDLNGRIQHFEKTNPDEGQTFHALRMVGNVGAHGEPVTSTTVLDILELYEDALEKLYSGKAEKLKAIQKKILANKGKL
jgi:hypothetical protein